MFWRKTRWYFLVWIPGHFFLYCHFRNVCHFFLTLVFFLFWRSQSKYDSRPCNFFLHVHLQFLKMISKKDFTQLIVFWPLPDSSTTFLKFHFFDCTLTVPITKLFQININDSGTHRRILMHFGLSVYDTWIERFFGKILTTEIFDKFKGRTFLWKLSARHINIPQN